MNIIKKPTLSVSSIAETGMKYVNNKMLQQPSKIDSMLKGHLALIKLMSGVAGLCLIATGAASAQQLDYGSYEALFGESVTKGATGTPQRISDVSADMVIITQDEIRTSGMRNLPEILRKVAGMDMQRTAPNSYNVSMRGYNRGDTDRLRVLVNGRDTFRTYNGTTRWSTIPVQLAEIRQIEIVRGPATALYGANAIAGVINIITFNPLYDDVSNVTGRIGLDGVREVSMVHTFKLPNNIGGIKASGSYFSADKFDEASVVDDGALVIDSDQKMFSLDGWLQLSPKVQLNLGIHALSSSTNVQEFSGYALAVQPNDISYKAALSAETGLGLIDVNAYINKLDEFQLSLIAIDKDGNPIFVEQPISSNSVVIEASDTFKVGNKSTIRLSAGYRKDEVVRFPTEPDGYVGYDNLSIGGLWEYRANEKLSASVSVRYDTFKPYNTASDLSPMVPYTIDDYENFGAFAFNLSAMYKPDTSNIFRFNIGRGVDSPSPFELGGYIFQNFYIDDTLTLPGGQGNPFVRESYSTEYELKWDHEFGNDLKSSVGVFYQRMTGFQSQFYQGIVGHLEPDGVTANWPIFTLAANTLNGDMYGGFVEFSGKMGDSVKWAVNYAYHDINDDPVEGLELAADYEDFGPDWVQKEFNQNRTSKHIVNADIRYSNDRFEFGVLTQYKSKYHSFYAFFPSELDVGSQFIVNATAAYKILEGISLRISAENLTNKRQLQASTPTLSSNRQVYMSLSMDF